MWKKTTSNKKEFTSQSKQGQAPSSSQKIRPFIEAALLVAVGLVLSTFTIYRAPLGGSVTLGSTLPLCIISLRSGARIGVLAGLNFGILSFLSSGLLIGLGPFFFDYIGAYAVLGAFGWLRKWPFLSIIMAQVGRLVCHVISGVLFFSQGKEFQEALVYSLEYNLSFLVPDVIIGMVLFYQLIKKSPKLLRR